MAASMAHVLGVDDFVDLGTNLVRFICSLNGCIVHTQNFTSNQVDIQQPYMISLLNYSA